RRNTRTGPDLSCGSRLRKIRSSSSISSCRLTIPRRWPCSITSPCSDGEGKAGFAGPEKTACHNEYINPLSQLREKAVELPALPGVYLYKDTHGTVIYVGKAKNLRNRVRSYFSEDNYADAKTGTLLHEAHGVDFIHVDNEKEALALENNLIKQWKPRY